MSELRAESHAHSYLPVQSGAQRIAFIGDLAFDGTHSYTADGRTGRWLDVLDRTFGELNGLMLNPRHGAPSGDDLLADQRRSLLMYRETVRRLAGGAQTLTDPQRAAAWQDR